MADSLSSFSSTRENVWQPRNKDDCEVKTVVGDCENNQQDALNRLIYYS
jgi:hypothetical protein